MENKCLETKNLRRRVAGFVGEGLQGRGSVIHLWLAAVLFFNL